MERSPGAAGILRWCRTTRRSSRAPQPTTGTGGRPTRRSSRPFSPRSSTSTGADGCSTAAAGRASSPSGSPTCSRRRSASIPTRPCSPRAAGSPRSEGSRTSAGCRPWPRTSPRRRRGRTGSITFGQSFHWTDEARVAEALYDMLEPGGALALIVHTVEGRPAPPSPGPPPIPHAEIKALVEKYLGSTRRAGQGVSPVRDPPLRGRPRSHPVRRAAVDLRPGHPRPAAGQRERAVGLLLDVLLGAAPVRRPRRGLRRRGARAAARRGRRRACSGTGPATPRSSSLQPRVRR